MAGEENTSQGGEGNFGQNLAGALQSAGSSAVQRATQLNQASQEPAPNAATSPPQATEATTQATGQAAPAPEPRIKYSRKGKTFDLGAEEAQLLIDGYMDTLEAAQAQMAAQGQTADGEAPPAQGQKEGTATESPPSLSDLMKQIKDLKQAQDDLVKSEKQRRREEAQRRQEDEQKQIISAVDGLFEKDKNLKAILEGDDKKVVEEDSRLSKAFVMLAKSIEPDAPLEAVGKKVTAFLDRYADKKVKAYIQTKVGHAANRTEGSGGGVPVTAPKKITNKEFWDGKVMESAYERAARAAMVS